MLTAAYDAYIFFNSATEIPGESRTHAVLKNELYSIGVKKEKKRIK